MVNRRLLFATGSLFLGIIFLSACEKSVRDPRQAQIELGKTLYFDTRLSSTNTISCNSCHNVQTNGTDNKVVSEGINGLKGTRNAPTVFDSGEASAQFWDGRAATLEDQAKGPMTNPVEMGMKNHDAVVEKIRSIKGYEALFKAAFPDSKQPVTIDAIAKAIAEYERTLKTNNSPFDKFQAGDTSAISASAKRGYQTFQSVGCITCHSGSNFAGPALPKGQAFFMKFPLFEGSKYDKQYNLLADTGKHMATKIDADKHFWRVCGLRNVDKTAPYFHNGSVNDLSEAVRVMAKTQLNKTLSDAEVSDIVAFLETLSGSAPKQSIPTLPK